ncbi:flagellar assembly protein FliW [Phycisphaera mikurensis]|uniref:Flagellar assembly factor FliW n=1 Tax=Phycisphaera mikurensis (strain NBRC 102666 / KCTC 22515 / FYK2301M01) TaxID=1142394 RepID=I0IAM5_PHYMF|nr:flagellar assembly protein FliW [Phycisphaera mikurensis]MBB6441691.1 flagellar assembly factor FliW [Phycisphaera mikurensis]BAM02313.1 flagellar assembly factor FliW [Phycisphaera mikurensis NBRC 102666]
MTLTTSRFGELHIDPTEEIRFPRGLLGFPGRTRFLLLEASHAGEPKPFWWLQSTEDGGLAFVVTDPALHVAGFRVPVGRAQLAAIGLEAGAAAAAVQVLVIVNKRGQTLTGNLQGPLLVNTTTRVGEQFVLSDKRFGTHVPLLNLKAEEPGERAAVVTTIGQPAALAS